MVEFKRNHWIMNFQLDLQFSFGVFSYISEGSLNLVFSDNVRGFTMIFSKYEQNLA